MRTKDLYFIALVPDEITSRQVLAFKKEMEQHFHSSHALRSPAHVTLFMPFRYREDFRGRLMQSLQSFASSKTSFDVCIKNFGAFEPRVIYVAIEPNESLDMLHQALHRHMASDLKIIKDTYKNRGFHPHMTIAFRDLSKQNFRLAWHEFRNRSYEAAFRANALVLLKHTGTEWVIDQTFDFRKSPLPQPTT